MCPDLESGNQTESFPHIFIQLLECPIPPPPIRLGQHAAVLICSFAADLCAGQILQCLNVPERKFPMTGAVPAEFSFPAAEEAKFVRSRTRRKKDPLLDYLQRGQNIGPVKTVEDIR